MGRKKTRTKEQKYQYDYNLIKNCYVLRVLFTKNEDELISFLKSKKNMTAYIKELIKKDMNKKGGQ